MKKPMLKNKKGFTIIELIIVVAIVGILAVIAIVAIGSQGVNARNTKRLADMQSVISAMQLACNADSALSACTDTGTDQAVLSTCSENPNDGSGTDYINLATVNDPSGAGLIDDEDEGNNYTLALEADENLYNQCDPNILFDMETSSGTYDTGCARNTGIEQGIADVANCT